MYDQPLIVRRDAAQATLVRFKDKPFRLGRNDCARMVAFHLRQLGYPLRLAKAGSYSSPLTARRALRRLGFANVAAGVDSYGLPQIAPAAALVGDIIELAAEDEFGALAVAMGNGRALAYHQEAAGAVVVQPLQFVRAWRADPCPKR